MGQGASSSSNEFIDIPLKRIPKRYEPITIVGEGACGVVIKCKDCKTNQTVAIKLSTSSLTLENEISILKKLNKRKFEDSFVKVLSAPWPRRYIVMEMLDMTFRDYLMDNALMKSEDIRTVIEQLAVAFTHLRAKHVIHADFKLNNIMLVDHVRQPLKVKIIDFGMALFDNRPLKKVVCQAYGYRAPEILLKIPFGAALDIWSLGCVLATMIFGIHLFPGRAAYDQLYYMTDLLGPAPQHILNASEETCKYFKHTDQGWVLQTPIEHSGQRLLDKRQCNFTTLDEAKRLLFESDDSREKGEGIELLKSMLKWDAKERITPQDILKHPFIITKSFHKVRHYSDSRHRHQATYREDSGNHPSTSAEHGSELQYLSAENSDLSAENSARLNTESEQWNRRMLERILNRSFSHKNYN